MFDQEKYLNLLCAIAPKPIESEEQYDYYLKLVEPFFPGDNCTPEETAIYSILCLLIEQYEDKHYPLIVTTLT